MDFQNQTVLVTGASGFIATHCIIELLKKGYRVRGTVRDLARTDSIRNIIKQHVQIKDDQQLTFAAADLLNDAGWDAAAKDCTYVLHVASPFIVGLPKHPDDLIIPAREGTLRVLEAAKNNQVKKVVLTSSIAAVCFGHENEPPKVFTENDWTNPNGKTVSSYILSKYYAERVAWDFAKQNQLNLVTILPGAVLGPALEKDYGTSAEMIRKLMSGKLPGCPHVGWPLADVRDVAFMHVAALENPAADGQRFFCTNDFMWFVDIAKTLREHFPNYRRKIPSWELPNWMVHIAAFFDPSVKSIANELGYKKEASNQKAKQAFHWQPRSNQEAIIATAESLIKFGVV